MPIAGFEARAAQRSARGTQFIMEGLEPSQHTRLARCPVERFLCQIKQCARVKACRKPFQAKRGNLPVAVAAGTAQQINIAPDAFRKEGAQFCPENRIVSGCGGQCFVEGSCFVGHACRSSAKRVKPEFNYCRIP